MKQGYAVMGLVLAVGVLTSFVLNTQQAPSRWEYGQLSLSVERVSVMEWSGILSWQSVEGSPSFSDVGPAFENATPQLLEYLGCEGEMATEDIYLVQCLGAQGWEMFYVAETSVEGRNDRSYWFKRPVL
jgi:hypothetical protein